MLDERQDPTGDEIEANVGDDAGMVGVGKGITQTTSRTGDVHVHIGEKSQHPQESVISMTVEEELRRKLIEHELALGKLELYVDRNDQMAMDYIRKLQTDMTDMRENLKELAGLELVSTSNTYTQATPWVPVVTLSVLIVMAVVLIISIVTILYVTLGGSIPTASIATASIVQFFLLVAQWFLGKRYS